MEINIAHQKDFIFEGENENGDSLTFGLDANKKGVSPMQMVLMSVAGCSSYDIINILNKKRQTITNFKVKVSGDRVDAIPAVFSNITITYSIEGDIKPESAKKAMESSLDKYCSVSKMLEPKVEIKGNILVNGIVVG